MRPAVGFAPEKYAGRDGAAQTDIAGRTRRSVGSARGAAVGAHRPTAQAKANPEPLSRVWAGPRLAFRRTRQHRKGRGKHQGPLQRTSHWTDSIGLAETRSG